MTLKTTLFAAANASDFIQLDGHDVLRPIRIRDGALYCSTGQDEFWIIPDQEIDVDDSGAARVQARNECGIGMEMLSMRFVVSRPLTTGDLTAVGSVLERKRGS